MYGRSRQSMSMAFGAAAALFGVTAAGASIEINQAGWKFPNVVTAAKEMIRVSDRTPLIAGKETVLKGYRKMDGTHFMTYEIEGRVFGVQFDTDGKPPFEYSIMDADGDGKFETKFVMDKDNKDQGYVPQWIIDFYYSKHPELKNPSNPAGAAKPVPPSLSTTAAAPAASPEPKKEVPPPEILSQPNP